MPELTTQERLQPALLDRLTDLTPGSGIEPRELRLITKQKLRQSVIRDLGWLLNATRPSDKEGLIHFPYARASVLNFGLPSLSGETASTLDVLGLEARIRQAIIDFEPRIDGSTLQVKAVATDMGMDQHNVICVEIRGLLWARPVALELMLRTEVDLETGAVQISDQTISGNIGSAAG